MTLMGSGSTRSNATQDATAEPSEVLRGVSAASTTPRTPPPAPRLSAAAKAQAQDSVQRPAGAPAGATAGHSRDQAGGTSGPSCPSRRRALGLQLHQVPPRFLAVWDWCPRA